MNDIERSSSDSVRFPPNGLPAVEISIDALNKIRKLASGSADIETGGILVGSSSDTKIKVTDVSDAGPNAQRSRTYFLRDTEHCRRFLEMKFVETGADYVGEWHTHVLDLTRLSPGDLMTVAGIFVDPDYDFTSFAIVLVRVHRSDSVLLVYFAQRQSTDPMRVVVSQLYKGNFPESKDVTRLHLEP